MEVNKQESRKMKKSRDNSWAVGLYSFLTVLTTAAVGDKAHDFLSNGETFESGHSLILPDERHFTESLIIVGTMDGKLRALDPAQNGRIRWSTAVSDKPLLSSSLSSVQMMKEFIGFRLVPSLDGGLYQLNWDSIEAIPLTADTLLSSSFKLNEGIALVGSKGIDAMGIDPGTGKVIYSCSNDGCNENSSSDTLGDVLVVKRVQKTVRAVSERTGTERWNFSVGQHTLNLLSADQKRSHERILEESSDAKPNIQVSIPDGTIAGIEKHLDNALPKIVLWKRKFDTPVAAVWLLEDGRLQKLDLLKITAPPKSTESYNIPLMYYIGSHKNQLYIHPSDIMKESVNEAIAKASSPAGHGGHNHALAEQTREKIIWKPYLATSASRTPAIVGKTELAVQKTLDYPFDNGHYFYGQLPNRLSDATCQNNNTKTNGFAKDGQQGILVRLKKSFLGWWKELLILIFTVGFFLRQLFKFYCRRTALNNTSVDSNQSKRIESDESKSSSSSLSLPQENFTSRYQCDFEHETCFAKGAFGLVFQARNKLDDCQYAVKRIRLPNDHKARSKVMREVKVLATLDHPGIVRYYNSWCEKPPVEWLKEWDEKLKGDSSCSTLASMASLTETSEESKDLLQIAASNDDGFLGDEESMIQNSKSKSSRKRLDTLTVENENTFEKSGSSVAFGSESSASFNVEFRPHSFSKNTSNNNGRKVNDESSDVIFERSNNSNKNDEDSSSNVSRSSSRSNNADGESSSAKDNFQLHLLYIQMQLCCRDSLKDWLSSNVENRDFSMSINIFKQLVIAVEYIHEKGHIHRDLKPSNILFAPDGAVKVGDFGLVAARQPCVQEESDNTESKKPSNRNLTGQVGTHLYMSPEQVNDCEYCSRVDIFSLGIIFFELFYVFKTQMERNDVLTAVRKRNIPGHFIQEMPLQNELALWLLAENPEDRPSAQDILSSPVFMKLVDELSPLSSDLQ